MSNTVEVRWTHDDRGLCRKYYMARNRAVYCQQENFPDQWAWYACTRDGEPSHEVSNVTIVTKF